MTTVGIEAADDAGVILPSSQNVSELKKEGVLHGTDCVGPSVHDHRLMVSPPSVTRDKY